MNATMPRILAQALAPFAQQSSAVHQILRTPEDIAKAAHISGRAWNVTARQIAAHKGKTSELTDAQRQQADMALHADKVAGGPQSRNFDAAMRLQMTHQDATGALL